MSLLVENLSFSYGTHEILHQVSFDVKSGEFLAVIGPNGVGKSTLFRCILGLQRKFTGKIYACGSETGQLSPKERAHRIAYIPQVHRPTFGYSVMDTVLMGTTRYLSPFQQPGEEQIQQALQTLKMVGMEDFAEKNYAMLSGGQQQLVLIARALAQDARLLLMDEPTSALDYGNQMKVLKLIRQLADKGYSVVVSTHNPQHAVSFADKVLALVPDRSCVFGTAKEVVTTELMNQLYGIDVDFLASEGELVLVPKCREVSCHV